ncbi:hypothetical protein BDV95DRAFT_557284 [Massariosphaeria phaeospora]|uniref:Uncharacterized protein n=1 Tax=Massariosphaeria phaeospora TaxID=100035 RepID=A0A7C8IK39_9PLEO|nr:hypothetical protein BDV95DRAFT_557284 [Massariosphaeria phaeospora]
MADQTPAARLSRFREATMNSTSSIRAPPDELWKDLAIDELIDRFNEESSAPARHKRLASVPATPSSNTPAPEGPFGRFSRAVASLFSGSGFSTLAKSKAAPDSVVEKDDRKERAEAAYEEAKEFGLLPTPKVFVRPVARPRFSAPSLRDSSATPIKTPTLYKSPSKKDLVRQKKLSKRVSDLEFRLAEARKDLLSVLGEKKDTPLPAATLPPTPASSHFWSENELSPHALIAPPFNLTKKRKSSADDSDYKAVSTDTDASHDSGHENKRSRMAKRSSARLLKKKSGVTKEEVVIVVPDGVTVPPIPSIPKGMNGKRVAVSDDGFGGLGHEIF